MVYSSACKWLGLTLRAKPKWIAMNSSSPFAESIHDFQVQAMQKADELKQLARLSGVRLPCIAKSASACGTTDAHQMSILTQWSQMDQLRIPDEAILQNFHNHGGVLYKVYVIGEKVTLPSFSQSFLQNAGMKSATWHWPIRKGNATMQLTRAVHAFIWNNYWKKSLQSLKSILLQPIRDHHLNI